MSRISKLFPASLLAFSLLPQDADAKPLRILHTNDLHSYFEHAENTSRGGYAALKATIDRIKLESHDQGVDTLTLDAGDFLEGSPFFFAGAGEESWRLMNAMGYDAVTLGNHDWQMGPDDLDALLSRIRPTFNLLGANYIFEPYRKNLTRHVRKYALFNRAGARIAVVGLTTPELFYHWRAKDGFVYDPRKELEEISDELRDQTDAVIALTHLGVKLDQSLVMDSENLDLVVGGHSHTQLAKPVYQRDRRGRAVPIVQAGKHGEYLGNLLLDVQKGKRAQLISYELIPILPELPGDPQVQSLVGKARDRLENEYTPDWLYEPLGYSEIPMEVPREDGTSTRWGTFVGNALREATGADLALLPSEFFGVSQAAGPVTREKIIGYFPRVFEVKNRMGWLVWETRIPGWVLETLVKRVLPSMGFVPQVTGLTYDVRKNKSGRRAVTNFKVNGMPLSSLHEYRVAVPEGAGRGVLGISSAMRFFFHDPKPTEHLFWEAIEKKIRREGIVTDQSPIH